MVQKQPEEQFAEEAEEMNMSKLDYHLDEYPHLLAKALIAEKGQKALIKRLYNDQAELIEKCSVNDLRRAVYEGSFVSVLEGRKLAALFIPKIGLKGFWLLVKNVIQKSSTAKKLCEYYGEIFLSAWKSAEPDENRRNVELIFEDVVRYAITTDLNTSESFRSVLNPLLATRNKQTDTMIERILRPNLWRCLKSVNGIARYNACKLFFSFYPLVKEDDLENGELLGVQLNTIADLLADPSVPIRAYACKQALYIFSLFWSVFSTEYRKTNFGKIVDKLARDVSSEVRLAVFEGMRFMIPCPEAVNAVENAVKRIILWGVNDNVVKIRIAAFQLLGGFKNHRYIKWWNVIELRQILERLEIEKVEAVKKVIAELLIGRVFTVNITEDEILKKVVYLGNMSRLGVIKFHECISKHQLIGLEQAVEHLIAMGTTVYKLSRSYERHHQQSLASFDITDVSFSSIDQTPPLVVDAAEGLFFHSRFVIKESSLVETILVLGSTLRGGSELTQIANIIFKELSSSAMDSAPVAGYVEALANWNLSKVIEIVDAGLKRLQIEFKNLNSQKKSRSKDQVDVRKVFLLLETMLKSPTIQQNLVQNFHGFLMKFYLDSSLVKDAISRRISLREESWENFPLFLTENAIRALELRQTLAIILVNVTKDAEEHDNILSEIRADLDWFAAILPNLVIIEEEKQLDFLNGISQAVLHMLSVHLESCSCSKDFLHSVGNVLEMLCNQKAPHSFIVPVTRSLRSLFLALVSLDTHEISPHIIYPLINICLVWVVARCEDEGFDAKTCAGSFLHLLAALQTYSHLTEKLLLDLSKTAIAVLIAALKDANSQNLDCRDPREIDFEVEPVVALLIHRILFKNFAFLRSTLISFQDALAQNLFFAELEGEEVLYMYGATIQFLYLCDVTAEEIAQGHLTTVTKPCAIPAKEKSELQEIIHNCFNRIKRSLVESHQNANCNSLCSQLIALCPYTVCNLQPADRAQLTGTNIIL
ncbi:unnamed protein product [Enterobius vermicularis]|uniref:Condensin-2 complex subunit G2 n=1 Tax=Enterobius vermicularis TaxID=51028 RepID=A0A0N4UUS6_ENTVE|nr:unnamed protein product [Enterobius vermicularis]